MILVVLGTQDKKFYRLLRELDRLIDEKVISEKVIVQAGFSSDYKSNNMEIFDLIPIEDFDKLISEANLLIAHGGVGSILTGLKFHKKVIAIPRLKKYREHVNDHQMQIIDTFSKENYIIALYDEKDLKDILLRIDEFKPREYKSNKENFVNLVKELIEK